MSKSIEEWWVCLGWRNWVEDISGNIWLFIWVLHIHSAPCAGFGLPASRLLAEKSKAAAHELVFIFFPGSLETFPELYFSTLTYISFFPSKDSRLQKLCLGWAFPPSLPITTCQNNSAGISPWGHIAPGPPSSHLAYRVRGCSGNFKAWSQVHTGILPAHVSCAEFSVRDLWHIYSHHRKSSWVTGRSRSWVSPGMKLPTKSKQGLSPGLRVMQHALPKSAELGF